MVGSGGRVSGAPGAVLVLVVTKLLIFPVPWQSSDFPKEVSLWPRVLTHRGPLWRIRPQSSQRDA